MPERASVPLVDLAPTFDRETSILRFDCPERHPGCERFTISILTRSRESAGWTATGDPERFEDLTLGPSIRSSCGAHVWVKLGRVSFVFDSR